MIRGLAGVAGAILICLAVSSCRTTSDGIALPRVQPGANPSGEAVTMKGRLVRSGACLALDGNGNTIVVWPVARPAEARPGGGTVVVVWPRTAQARADGNGNVIIVWPFRRTNPPIRTGETVELSGHIVTTDNITGYARLPADPGCRSDRYLIVRDVRRPG